jgi:hypothetical protein
MFGRGRRDDLDDEEGERTAREIREALKLEIRNIKPQKSSI